MAGLTGPHSAAHRSIVWTLLAVALALAALLAPVAPRAQPTFPALTGRVVDDANVLPPDMKARLDGKLAALEQQSQRQLVVVTLPSLQGYDISDYGYQLGRSWGLGDKTRNDGAVLIVAPNEKKLRIEVGYGLEATLTDGLSSLIINQTIVPKFKEGDLPAGIEAGADAIIHQLTLPPEEAAKVAAQAQAAKTEASSGVDFETIVFLLFVLFFFIIPMIRAMRGGKRYRRGGVGPMVIWPGSFGGGGGGGFSGGGGFGGGGFSGGGGSFGGGGASGSW